MKELNEKLEKLENITKPKIGIVGTTSWGTALSIIIARNHKNITLFSRSIAEANQLNEKRINSKLGESIKISKNIMISNINN